MYTGGGDKIHTPKHIGMASALHQATRSKGLVEMFHRAGYVMSYHDVIKLDTALAKKTLMTMDSNGAVVPPNLVKGALSTSQLTVLTLMRVLLMEKERSMQHSLPHGREGHLKATFLIKISSSCKLHFQML